MAINIKRWLFPFAVAGDKTPIPEAVDPAGAVSYPQGWGPDYERDPATDPLAKRIPRLESNQAMYDVTATLKDLQEQGLSWFIAAAQNGGVAFPYIKGARVLYDNAGDIGVYESLVNSNTAAPTDALKWVRDVAARFATQSEADAGSSGVVMVAPREMSRAVQSGRWNYATAAGTANALTVTLDPAPASWADLIGTPIRVKFGVAIGSGATLGVAGLSGTRAITRASGQPCVAGDVAIGQIAELLYDGTNVQISSLNTALLPARSGQMFTASGNFTVPANVRMLFVQCQGAGGQGGGSYDTPTNIGAGGGAGAYTCGYVAVEPGQVIPVTVGLGGYINNIGATGATGGSSSFGSYLNAPGGKGGACGASAPIGGDGGVPSAALNPSAFFFDAGGDGEDKTVIAGPNGQYGGKGGASFFGGGVRSSRAGGTGGGSFGGGGAGANQGAQVAGRGGSQGIVIVEY